MLSFLQCLHSTVKSGIKFYSIYIIGFNGNFLVAINISGSVFGISVYACL